MTRWTWVVVGAVMAVGGVAARGEEGVQEVRLEGVGSGMVRRVGSYIPQGAELSARPPGTLRVAPQGLKNPLYGVLPVGNKDLGRVFHVVLAGDAADGPKTRLWVDTNGNGDLTDDGPVEWRGKPERGDDGKVYENYEGRVKVDLGPAGRPFLATLGVYQFDPRTPGLEAKYKTLLAYYRDYGREGKAVFGAEELPVALEDRFSTGDLSGRTRPAKPFEGQPPLWLFVDRNGNGKVDGDGEMFDVTKPFTINGVTYEVRHVAPGGESLTLARSAAQGVAELPVPADVAVGKALAGFDVQSMEGKRVRVPGDYRGKVLLIDFWATWCGACLAEMPDIAGAYGRYHGRGLEVLGVSADEAADRGKVEGVCRAKGMVWPEVFDGKGRETELAMKYGVAGYPTMVLVDGDTGVVLATTEELRGEKLGPAVERALKAKGK